MASTKTRITKYQVIWAVPYLVIVGKSWHFFLSKSSTLYLSSWRLSPEDSETDTFSRRSFTFSQQGQKVGVVFTQFPMLPFLQHLFKTLLLRDMLSGCHFISEPITGFSLLSHLAS